jgi:hypothetical protein
MIGIDREAIKVKNPAAPAVKREARLRTLTAAGSRCE